MPYKNYKEMQVKTDKALHDLHKRFPSSTDRISVTILWYMSIAERIACIFPKEITPDMTKKASETFAIAELVIGGSPKAQMDLVRLPKANALFAQLNARLDSHSRPESAMSSALMGCLSLFAGVSGDAIRRIGCKVDAYGVGFIHETEWLVKRFYFLMDAYERFNHRTWVAIKTGACLVPDDTAIDYIPPDLKCWYK